jgi:hypothetical protein
MFFALQKSDPSNLKLSVLKFKFNPPESVIDEKQCDIDTERVTRTFGPNQAVEFSDALSAIAYEIGTKNDEARAAAQDAADKAAADRLAAEEAAQIRAKKAAAAKADAAPKKTTITCIKGKLTKKVTGVKPKCPTGYKVKK